MTITGSAMRLDDLRGYAQGEIFLLKNADGRLAAQVYNTTGFGPVPADKFNAIDVQRLAADTGSDLAWKNPRRFWMMDAATVNLAGEPRELQGLTSIFRVHEEAGCGTGPGTDFSVGWCLAARLSRRVGGVPRARGFPFLSWGGLVLVSRVRRPAGG